MRRFHESLAAEYSAAALMRIGELVASGKSLGAAKAQALKEAGLDKLYPETAENVRRLVGLFTLADLPAQDRKEASRRVYAHGVDSGIFRDTWINRWLWRLFGLTW